MSDATELRHLIDPICSSCNDAGCEHCGEVVTYDDLNDMPPDTTADRLFDRDADLYFA